MAIPTPTRTAEVARGINAPAWLTGLVRGVIEAALIAGVAAIVGWLQGTSVPEVLQLWAPSLILVLRSGEGVIDQIDPAKKRADGGA